METAGGMIQESETVIKANFPQDLYNDIKRIAKEEGWPIGRALILVARLGANVQKENQAKLEERHRTFVTQGDLGAADQAGDEMLRSIFGPDSIA